MVRGRVNPALYHTEEAKSESRLPLDYDPKSPSHLKFRGKREPNDDLGTFSSFYKRGDPHMADLGSFSSFYKRRLFKRNTDDLDTFSSLMKKRNSVDDLGSFTSFLRKRGLDSDLGGFTSFYKKNRMRRHVEDEPDIGGFSSIFKRNADEDLGGFSSFIKRDALDDLGAFSAFQAGKRRKRDLDMLDTFSSFATKRVSFWKIWL